MNVTGKRGIAKRQFTLRTVGLSMLCLCIVLAVVTQVPKNALAGTCALILAVTSLVMASVRQSSFFYIVAATAAVIGIWALFLGHIAEDRAATCGIENTFRTLALDSAGTG